MIPWYHPSAPWPPSSSPSPTAPTWPASAPPTSSTMPTPLPWPTPSPTPIPPPVHHHPVHHQYYSQFHPTPTTFSTPAPGPGDHLFGQPSMLHSSWPTMPSSSIPTNSPTLPTFPSTTTAPQVPQPNVPPITPSHPGFPTLTPSGRFETPILSLHQRQPFRRIQDHHLQFHATRLSRPSCPFQFDIIVLQLLPHRPIHHLNQLPPHQCYLHH